jgi:hypothetical protein
VPLAVLKAVGDLYDLRIVTADQHDTHQLDAVIIFDGASADAGRWLTAGVRTLAYVGGTPTGGSSADEVRFADSPSLPRAFRNVIIRRARPGMDGLVSEPCDQPLCLQDGRPMWVKRGALELVKADLRVMGEAQSLHQLWTTDWLSLLPLLHLAQDVSGWELPSPRACLMFDDPNLHWPSYGYINYAALAAHAERLNYHVALATVPLDAWYAHPPTVRLFHRHRSQLSLLVHGNDHTHFELHRARSPHDRQLLAAQALQRVDRLERVTGLAVARVMAAPHAACSPEMARSLTEAGYEGACISRGALVNRNPGVHWPASVGFATAEFLGGLPVYPRFNLLGDMTVEARLAAMLGQAIIPVGHHEDLRHGLGLLEHVADAINRLGEVSWQDMTAIAASSVHTVRRDDLFVVKAFSRRFTVSIPEQARCLRVVRPWLTGPAREQLTAEARSGPSPVRIDEDTFQVAPGSLVTICATARAFDYRSASPRRSSLPAVARRQLAEGRDRLRPFVEGAIRRLMRRAS